MSNLFRSIEEPVIALVDRWIIDYFCRILWKHFEEQGTVINEWIDGFIQERHCIQVLETQPGDNLDLLELQSRLLIQFMCRMSAGSFGTTIVNLDLEDGRTELEDAIELLEQIISVGNHGMSSTDLLRVRISVKQQAVYACCREGNFELAAKVFFRQWKSWKTREEMEARKNIAEVLDSRNHIHEHLKLLTYENTINDCKQILRKIFNNMAPPFLVTAAKNVWERMKNEDVVKEADSDCAEIMKVKREQTDKGVLFNRQTDADMSESLVNEVCAHNGSMLTSTSSVTGLQILSDLKQPRIYAPAETLVTMMPAANKSQTYPLILWTNSVSSNVLSPTVSSASVHISDEAQVTVSNSFMQQRKEVVGPEQRMYLSLSSNQFSLPEEIYLNTVPVVSSQVYATTPLLQEPGNLVASGSIQQMWNVPTSTTANVDLTETEPTVVQKPAVVRKRNRRRGRRRVNAKIAETSLPTVPVSQPPPLMTEVAKTSPAIKQKGRSRGKIRSSTRSVTPVLLEDTPVRVENEVPSSPATDAKRPRITLSVSLQPKKARPFRNGKNQTTSDSSRGVAAEKFPVVRLTKISSQMLQKKLPSTEVSNRSQNLKTRLQATGPRHAHKDSFNSEPDYAPETKRKSYNSSGLSSWPGENLPRTNRKNKVLNDSRLSDILPSLSETIGTKRNRSSSPAKKQVAYPSRLVPKETSIILSSQMQSTPEKDNKTKKGSGTKAPWNPDEIDKFYKAVQKYGHHWAMIARYQLPGRSPSDLSNKWRSILYGKQVKLLEEKFGPV